MTGDSPAETLQDIRDRADKRRNKDRRFARLHQLTERALLLLDGNLYSYAARAAIAELAESWYETIKRRDDTNIDTDIMARADVTNVKDELDAFAQIFYENAKGPVSIDSHQN